MKKRYWTGRIRLATGKIVAATLADDCAAAGTSCRCGFCKGNSQCQFGDCRGEIVQDGSTLCPDCASRPWKVALSGHSAGMVKA